jgi:CDP-diacylglycerol--serine O-phosphatidyltransferase
MKGLKDRLADPKSPERRPRRAAYALPTLFTAGNIFLGYISILRSFEGATLATAGSADAHLAFANAAKAIGAAFLLDGLDGRIARMTNTTSEFGKELDSLADAITFGMAPSLLALIWGFHFLPDSINPRLHLHLQQAGAFICFLFLMGGVSRLARFNISSDAQPRNPGRPGRKYFVGMPIPAAAGLVAATVHFFYGIPVEDWWWWVAIPWLVLVGLSGFLMVSTWRFWSGKEINFSRAHPFQLLFVLSIVLYVCIRYSNVVLFAIALIYMFSGIWARAAYSWSRRRRRRPSDAAVLDADTHAPEPDPMRPL